MTTTGLPVFDKTLEKTNIWVNDVAKELGVADKHKVFQGLRMTLHALRDRIPPEEATQVGSQLPILLAGFYYENWRAGATPTKERTKEAFLNHVRERIQNSNPDFDIDIERLVKAVFFVLAARISEGEIQEVVSILPVELRELMPESVRA
jgi:uncharacterized protein (DUF2267 family)